ncbi:MAG TPA: hypothetical protein DEP84_32600 [Chloroflexi bacterium]|nr:hypothetical protein [Chloroflexota bacterium]
MRNQPAAGRGTDNGRKMKARSAQPAVGVAAHKVGATRRTGGLAGDGRSLITRGVFEEELREQL